jgi:hypothetical protein
MPVVNMTDRFVKTLKPGAQAVEWFDEDTRGVSLKINPGGSVTWYYNYTRCSDGVRRRVQLGKVEALSVKDARLKARRTMGLVADGRDPADDRRADRQAMTVGELAEKYLTLYARSPKTCCPSWGASRLRLSPVATSAASRNEWWAVASL